MGVWPLASGSNQMGNVPGARRWCRAVPGRVGSTRHLADGHQLAARERSTEGGADLQPVADHADVEAIEDGVAFDAAQDEV